MYLRISGFFHGRFEAPDTSHGEIKHKEEITTSIISKDNRRPLPFENCTYSAAEGCFGDCSLRVEIMHPNSIYENNIGNFLSFQKLKGDSRKRRFLP
jgi:hypothetical protein